MCYGLPTFSETMQQIIFITGFWEQLCVNYVMKYCIVLTNDNFTICWQVPAKEPSSKFFFSLHYDVMGM
jgi:hypothetical protein